MHETERIPVSHLNLVAIILAVGMVLVLGVYERSWFGVAIGAAVIGGGIRCARLGYRKTALAAAIVLALGIGVYFLMTPMYRRFDVAQVDVAYEAALTFVDEESQQEGWTARWRLEERAIMSPQQKDAISRDAALRSEWTITPTNDGKFQLTRESVVESSVGRFEAVSPMYVYWSPFGTTRRQMGPDTIFVPRINSGAIRVRAPEHAIVRITPAPSRAAQIKRGWSEYTIPLAIFDRRLEAEFVHPRLRNDFAVWLRDFSLWSAPKWFTGIVIGVVAAGLGDKIKRLPAWLRGRRRRPKQDAGFKPTSPRPDSDRQEKDEGE